MSGLTRDLERTLQRIEHGEAYPHRNDGAEFHNREARLPHQPRGYYREYVHPNAAGSAGPMRVVVGRSGEVYYSPDHYNTFVRVR
jgi:filamentous hemagglutinin